MISLRKIYVWFFIVGIFFIPFNEVIVGSFLGEYKREAAAVFFLLGFVFYGIESILKRKLTFPSKSTVPYLFYLFLFWCIIATLFNYSTVSDNFFKGIGGIERFFRQYVSLLFSFILFFFYFVKVLKKWNLKEAFFVVRKAFLVSLLFVFGYGILEYGAVILGIGPFAALIEMISLLPLIDGASYHTDRISSVTFEPPYLAIFLITVAGFMFSYILTEKKIIKFIPLLMVVILAFISGSRTATIAIIFQILFFGIYFFKHKKFQKYLVYSFPVIAVGVIALFIFSGRTLTTQAVERVDSLNFQKNLLDNVSNRSRFGMQYASLRVFKDHPLTGVGFGQQTYHNRYYYPPWSSTGNYEFQLWYKNPNIPSFPPGYNIYTRLLAEVGFIGFLLFFLILANLFYKAYQIYKLEDTTYKVIGYSLLITFLGFTINWLQIDSFRMFGFWIAAAFVYLFDKKLLSKSTNLNLDR